MTLTRRLFIKGGAAGLAGMVLSPSLLSAAEAGFKYRIAARHFGANLESARKAGMDGVELCQGEPKPKLEVSDPAMRQKLKEKVKATGVVVASISMDFFNSRPLATESEGPAWVEQAIEAAKDLGATGMLLPFFGKAHLLQGGNQWKKDEVESLVKRLKDLAPKAKDAGVKLGVECTLPSKLYIELLDRVGSDSVGAYYDIGNCTGAGFDVPAEIRALKDHLALIHFKDGNSYLGEGKVKMEPIAQAIKDAGYKGWIVLETANPSKNAEADCKRNGDYSRKLMA